MRNRLTAWRSEIQKKVRSWRWRVPVGFGAIWWLADKRLDLAGRTNRWLDQRAIPVVSNVLGWIVSNLLNGAMVVGLTIAGILLFAFVDSRRQVKDPVTIEGFTSRGTGVVTPPEPVEQPPTHMERLTKAHPSQPPPVHSVLQAIEADQPKYSPNELEGRRLIREFITEKLSEIETFLHNQTFTATNMTRMNGPSTYERKWLNDTYYGLRDRDPGLADIFGDPNKWIVSITSSTVREKAEILREILNLL